MHSRMDRPLYDRYHVCDWLCHIYRQQLAPVSEADSSIHLWSSLDLHAILHHATFHRTRNCCIENFKSSTSEGPHFDKSYCIWHRPLSFRIISQPVAIVEQIIASSSCFYFQISIVIQALFSKSCIYPPWTNLVKSRAGRFFLSTRPTYSLLLNSFN